MSRALIYTLIAILAVLLAPGCSSKEITRDDVTGRYVANFPDDQVDYDTLEVRPDGTYTHAFKSADGETAFTEDGTWHLEYDRGYAMISLKNYTITYEEPEGLELKKTGGRITPVEDGGSRINIINEGHFHYDKQQ